MSDPRFMLDVALKAQQWEIAKGHLRALAAMQGSYAASAQPGAPSRWLALEAKIDAFIEGVEDEGLHE